MTGIEEDIKIFPRNSFLAEFVSVIVSSLSVYAPYNRANKKENIFHVIVITIFGKVDLIYGSRESLLEEGRESEKGREIKGRKDENNGIRPQRLGEWTTVEHKTV